MPDDEEPYRRMLARVAALDLEAAFAEPRGDRAFAAACVARWLASARAWLAPEGPAMRAFHAQDPSVVEWLDRFMRPAREHPLPDALTIEWAEGPFEILVSRSLLVDEVALDGYGWFRGGLYAHASATVDFLARLVEARGSDAVPEAIGRPFATEHPDRRAAFARWMLGHYAGHVVRDVLHMARHHPRRPNPYEPELALLEAGLWPLGIDGSVCRVFRASPSLGARALWLPYFSE